MTGKDYHKLSNVHLIENVETAAQFTFDEVTRQAILDGIITPLRNRITVLEEQIKIYENMPLAT